MALKKLREMLDSKEISAVELTEQYLDRIENSDKEINSYITVCKENALADAKKAQEVIDSGNSGAFTGLPISVKDNICTLGVKTTCASHMLDDFIPPYNATVMEKLKKDNIVMLGKTNMDEFAMGGSSQTSYFGGVKNPYDLTRVTGGSSGGAAASVSADLCAAALGSDTGGSVRQPASFCGVTGLKPTYGTVSRWGLIAFASSLDQIGVIAKSAEDTGYMLEGIYGYDENDATSSKKSEGNYNSLIGSDVSKLKIGVPKEFFGDGLNDEVKTAVLNAVEYYKKLGCEIVDVSLPSLEYAVSAYYLISSAEAASNLSRFDGIKYGLRSGLGEDFNDLIKNSRREGFGQEVKRRIMLGTYVLSSGYYDAYYKKACLLRQNLISDFDDIFNTCDVLIAPTAPNTAFELGFKGASPVDMYLSDIATVPINITGVPAISVPVKNDKNGLPIGMQIIGKKFSEKKILDVAYFYEKLNKSEVEDFNGGVTV